MKSEFKKCPDCGYELKKKYNSTLYMTCPRCKVVKRIVKKRLKLSHANKFNLYTCTAWKWCKMYVLLYYCDDKGYVKCSTSPNLEYHVTDRNIHVGHYIKWKDGNSSHNSTALEFYNLAPQSARDNNKHNGKPEQMRVFLVGRHGEEAIQEIERLKNIPLKFDPVMLQEISDKYRIMFYDLLEKRKMQNPFK